MQIGAYHFDFPLYLAPMAGVTDKIFRQLCKANGADVLTTEFVSAEGIFRRNERTLEYLDFEDSERPLGIQLFGADPSHLAEAARMAVEWKHPDFIDLNFGCPVNKVVSKNGGSALLKNCPLLKAIAEAVVKAVAPVPVTAKIRIGWCADSVNATATAKILEDCGISVLTVHGRTKDQGYSGRANWEVIGQVAQSVSIPVIGNGDIDSPLDVQKHKAELPVAGVMIGRAAMSAPWIFSAIKSYLNTGQIPPEPGLEQQWAFIRNHCRLVVEAEGSEHHAMASMRSRLMAYSRGMPEARTLRSQLQHMGSLAELDEVIAHHLNRPA